MNELTMNLKTHSKIPLYEQIYNYIKSDIQNGKVAVGENLPRAARNGPRPEIGLIHALKAAVLILQPDVVLAGKINHRRFSLSLFLHERRCSKSHSRSALMS